MICDNKSYLEKLFCGDIVAVLWQTFAMSGDIHNVQKNIKQFSIYLGKVGSGAVANVATLDTNMFLKCGFF